MKHSAVSYGNFTDPFLDELTEILQDKKVLEVFAGNGLLASRLAARGVDIMATSQFSGHDGHEIGMFHDVIEMDATEAVLTLGANADILLMSWPTADEGATRAALAWGSDRPIVFIGEITQFDKGTLGLGGCASDLFFQITAIDRDIPSYEPRNFLERAVIMHLSRDAVRKAFREQAGEG
jgi:hypothetical protein